MKTVSFLDTNILVYAYDYDDPGKQKTAEELLSQLFTNEQAVVSSQVVQEFLNVAFGKFKHVMPTERLFEFLEHVLGPICRHFPNLEFYKNAGALRVSNSLNFYDALIVQAAIDLGCDVLYSEDLQNGQKFGKLTVKNPFKT